MDQRPVKPILYIATNNDEEKDSEVSNIVQLGGREPPVTGDWLSTLELGTIFLIQDRTNFQDFNLGHFKIVDRTETAVILVSTTVQTPLFIDPARFCKKYALKEKLGVMKDDDIEAREAALADDTPDVPSEVTIGTTDVVVTTDK